MSELHTKFGELLKLERERQGISLNDVSGELKIAKDSLLDIEAGDASALPSELYFKMFSRSYAEHLGIDYSRTIEAMREELGEPLEPDTRVEAQTQKKRKPSGDSETASEDSESATGMRGNVRRLVILTSVIVGAFVIFLLARQIFFADGAGEGDENTTETATTEPGMDADAGRTVSADEAYNWDVPTYQPPDSIGLTLVARQESWATVVADSDTVLYQTLTPGRRYTLTAKYRFRVSIGIPRAVDVMIDGQPAYLAGFIGERISRVEIDQTNRDRFRSPPELPTPTVTTATNRPETRTDNVDSTLQRESDST